LAIVGPLTAFGMKPSQKRRGYTTKMDGSMHALDEVSTDVEVFLSRSQYPVSLIKYLLCEEEA
jgi:hypothetical protein